MFSQLIYFTLVSTSSAHTLFHKLSVNGVDQGSLAGIRVAKSNYPILDVTSNDLICNKNYSQPVSSKVIDIEAGATVGAFWGHVVGGAQYPNDKDNPIAASHHGPILTYLAKVDNAATASPAGLQWFKIQHDGKDEDNVWAVDRLYAAKGWYNFTIPACIAPGNYLMRHEIIALHSAAPYPEGGRTTKEPQFYMGCAQINITGSGTFAPSSTVSIPGVYSSSDPGIDLNIWSSTQSNVADIDGKSYVIPGPEPITCDI